jgi:gliding motility associated protien GldN
MKIAARVVGLLVVFCSFAGFLAAQVPSEIMTESGSPAPKPPLDDIVENTITLKKRVLPYDQPREADIFWKKRIWRLIDVREKMNQPFVYPKRPFLQILLDATNNAEHPLRIFQDEEFKQPMDTSAVNQLLFRVDTITVTDPETYEIRKEIVKNTVDLTEDIQRFRVKEIWFFDKETSTMQVRILGIAPVRPIKGINDAIVGENAMFWIYYPEAREALARERVFNDLNDANPMTWEDIFEMRFFASYIYKESNVKDFRLQDEYAGRDLLLEADKVKQQIFNFEHDLWTY